MSTTHLTPEYLAENRGPTIIAVNATFQAIATLVVCARIGSKVAILKRIGLDDWTIVVATILATANIVVASQSVRLGTGKHKQAIPLTNVVPAGIYRFVTRVIYFLISGTIKLSVCFLYLRLFKTLRKHILALIIFIIASTIAQEFSTIFQCVPVAGVWNTTKYPHARCINNVAFSYSASALSVVTDIWTLVLPLTTVWGLQIPLRKKVVLAGMFSLGMIACIAGIIRMVFLITLLDSTDPSWDTYGTSIASAIELALAIITASVPGLKPLVDRIFPKLFPNSTRSKRTNAQDYKMGSRKQGHSGFVSLGSRKDLGEDADSTKAIKVAYDYTVTSTELKDLN